MASHPFVVSPSQLTDSQPLAVDLPNPLSEGQLNESHTVHQLLGERPYATLVEEIRDFAIFILDLQGRILSWNEGAQLIFGYRKDEILGQLCDHLFTPEDREQGVPDRELQTARRQGRAEDVRWHLKKDGSRFWANGVMTALFDEVGEVRGFAKMARDDTPHKKSEIEREELLKTLEFERKRLSGIFQSAPAFIAVLREPQHVFELANPAFYQLIGRREIIGRPLLEALPEIADQDFVERLERVLLSGQPYQARAVPVHLRRESSGLVEERFVDLLFHPLLEFDGTISGVLAHGVDITGEVRARQAAEAASRIKDDFLATLSHELRTPLTAILGWATILQADSLSSDDIAQGLAVIERNAQSQAQLVEDVLDLSRFVTGQLRMNIESVDLEAIIHDAIHTMMPAAKAKNIDLEHVSGASAILVSGDPLRLQQIVWNLLSNAIKFTPCDGWVRVRLERMNSHIEIEVSDNGIGIAPEVLPHVFEHFRQADSSSTRSHGGLGLGLSIVQRLTELHGGSVEGHSPGLGQGATFTVQLLCGAACLV
jgi:PAS domain S-box-containing protein